jgi:uncharacterized membrane protein YphA (DoxX/SURF4 family)
MWKTIIKAARAAVPSMGNGAASAAAHGVLYHLLRLGLGGLFVYAGFIKLLDPGAFARSLAQFDLAPEPLLPILALGLPALEVLAGAGLIFRVRGSLTLTSGLLGLFLLALGYAVLMEMDIDCGCFTAADLAVKTGVKTALLRDLFMAAALGLLFWRGRRSAGRACISKMKNTDVCERRKV